MHKNLIYSIATVFILLLYNTASPETISREGGHNPAFYELNSRVPGILIYIEGEVRIGNKICKLANLDQRINFEDSLVLYPGSKIILLLDDNTTRIIGPIKAITLFTFVELH